MKVKMDLSIKIESGGIGDMKVELHIDNEYGPGEVKELAQIYATTMQQVMKQISDNMKQMH